MEDAHVYVFLRLSLSLFVGAACVAYLVTAAQNDSHRSLIPRDLHISDANKNCRQIGPNGGALAYVAPFNGSINVWIRKPKTTPPRIPTRLV